MQTKKNTTWRVRRRDFVGRILTVSVGAPVVILLLSSRTTSSILLHAVHLLCALEWTRLVPLEYPLAYSTRRRENWNASWSLFLVLFPVASLIITISQHALPALVIFSSCLTLMDRGYPQPTNRQGKTKEDESSGNAIDSFSSPAAKRSEESFERMHSTILHCQHGLLYVSLGFRHLILISSASLAHSLLFILVVWNGDTGAFVVGNLGKSMCQLVFGDSPLSADPVGFLLPGGGVFTSFLSTVSPKKTVTGMIGGLIFGTTTAVVLPKFLILICELYLPENKNIGDLNLITSMGILDYNNIPFLNAVSSISARRAAVGLVLSLAGVLGDLVESKVKRRAAAKDSGSVLPGHGGLLDRMDSTLIAATLYFWWCLPA